MKLLRVEIENYRSIRSVILGLEPPCRILVGQNECGKTNILKALALLGDEHKPDATLDVRHPIPPREDPIEEGDAYVSFVFHLDDKELAAAYNNASALVLARDKNPNIFSMGGEHKTLKDFCAMRKERLYDVDIISGDKQPTYWPYKGAARILPGWKSVPDGCPVTPVMIGTKEFNLADYRLVFEKDLRETPEGVALKDADITDFDGVMAHATNDIVSKNLPNLLFWRYTDEHVLPSSVSIDQFVANPDGFPSLKNMFLLAKHGDIAASIERYRQGSPNNFQNFLESIALRATRKFKKAWPHYSGIKFTLRRDGEEIIPGVQEKNTHDFMNRSDGFKRFITFLLMVSARVETNNLENTLLIIDEPEIGLHPPAVQAIRDELIRISEKIHVVCSTHSIFMVDPRRVDRHIIVTRNSEKTQIESVGDSVLEKAMGTDFLYQALGLTMFELLGKKNLVFEGWHDKCLFDVALRQEIGLQKKFKGIKCCPATGAPSINILASFLELMGRECLIVSDSDDEAVGQKQVHLDKKLKGKWCTYQDINPDIVAETGEDFVKNDHVVNKVNAALSGMSAPKFNDSDLPSTKTGKLAAIKKWLYRQKLATNADEANLLLQAIKRAIFDGLTSTNIDMPEYKKWLHGVAKILLSPNK